MKPLTRGQLAKKSGVNPETIRYYERLGLLPKALRSENGYRLFSEEDVKRIKFIKRDKRVVRAKIWNKRRMLRSQTYSRRKIKRCWRKNKRFRKYKKILQELIKQCQSKGSILNCPIISSIEN